MHSNYNVKSFKRSEKPGDFFMTGVPEKITSNEEQGRWSICNIGKLSHPLLHFVNPKQVFPIQYQLDLLSEKLHLTFALI
jgi:hypothetical protein